MTLDCSTTAIRWMLASVPLFLGAWILLVNVLRYTPLVRGRGEEGGSRLSSSVPFAGTLFVLIGLAIAPIEFRLSFLGIALFEIFSIDFAREDEDAPGRD